MSEWKVWYQPNAKFGRRYFSGTLTVQSGAVSFAGKKETFTISSAKTVEPRTVGMNTWVRVAYEAGGEEREALFLDRRMLGWSGILGGNDRLRAELTEALLPERP
jgi:hypothetical protein